MANIIKQLNILITNLLNRELKMRRKINKRGLELIKRFEGLSLKAYKCPAGKLTIGYGHTGSDVLPNSVWTQEYAEKMLLKDLAYFEKEVEKAVKRPITDNQFSALVSLAYNIGVRNFLQSTLLKKLNVGNYQGAADEFLRWCRAKGIILKGLQYRRQAERELFLNESPE